MKCDICGTGLALMDGETLWCPKCHWQYIDLSKSLTSDELFKFKQNQEEGEDNNG